MILGTGEIQSTPPGPTSNLLSIDQGVVSQTPSPNAVTYADIGLYTAVGFAVLDPILSGIRDGQDALIVDAVLYAETVALTEMLSDITKIAVRRPRPIDYRQCGGKQATNPECLGTTNFDLSFYSGHATTVAAIGATATYLAFIRDPKTIRPWLTLGLAAALTTFVSYERVASGDHFPTDVIAGSMAGAAIGILVPHLHRHEAEAPHYWIGAAPAPGGGGALTLGGLF
jgi:undecaprenyl-diphosphatase